MGWKREWEGKQLLPSPFPVQSSRLPKAHTHAGFVVVGHVNRTTKGRTAGGGGLTAARTGPHVTIILCHRQDNLTLFFHVAWGKKHPSVWR